MGQPMTVQDLYTIGSKLKGSDRGELMLVEAFRAWAALRCDMTAAIEGGDWLSKLHPE